MTKIEKGYNKGKDIVVKKENKEDFALSIYKDPKLPKLRKDSRKGPKNIRLKGS